MNARELKKLMKPLLARHSDLVMRGSFIFVRPVRHIGRALLLGGSSWKYRLKPRWAVAPMFVPDTRFDIDWGSDRMADHMGFDAREPVDIAYILHVFEHGALPILRAIDSIETFLAFMFSDAYANRLYLNSQYWLSYQVARGRLREARMAYAWQHDTWATTSPTWRDIDEERLKTAHALGALLWADDRAGLARVLHEVEARTVKRIGLEDLWEPSPFPLETLDEATFAALNQPRLHEGP
jgi:hypothetical protein